MTWFRVDDGFYSHPKTLATTLAASGLWVRAGAWVGQHLNDGLVPTDALRAISPTPPGTTHRIAAELVRAGLWIDVPGIGYEFHDWTDLNPTREKVMGEREAARKRQDEWRRRRRDEREDGKSE